MLCLFCQEIRKWVSKCFDVIDDEDFKSHIPLNRARVLLRPQPSIRSLQVSADQGCQLCGLLWLHPGTQEIAKSHDGRFSTSSGSQDMAVRVMYIPRNSRYQR